MDLSTTETRVLGCLLEKQRTTPDAYPLSLNALRLACNQSTNRDPVVDYDDAVIRDALHRLERRGYTRLASGAGSRAAKYRHLLADALPMSSAEQAVMCVLMLRGAADAGRAQAAQPSACTRSAISASVHETLDALIERGLVGAPRAPSRAQGGALRAAADGARRRAGAHRGGARRGRAVGRGRGTRALAESGTTHRRRARADLHERVARARTRGRRAACRDAPSLPRRCGREPRAS